MFITWKTGYPLIALTLLWLVPASTLPQVGPSSRTVALYVTVEDDDKLVGGLSQENFRLFEEDKPRPFQLGVPETPASIALLAEHSRISWYYYNDIVSAIQGFLNAAPEGNWYALATFAHQLQVDVDFTREKGKLAAAFAGLGYPTWNEVDTYDAVYEMLEKMERLPGRRVLIVIGSGFDSFSSRSLDEVQKKIESVNVLVYGVGAGSMLRGYYEPYLSSSARMDLVQAEAFLRMLADKSGGQAWFPRFEAAFPDVSRGLIQILEHQYKLVYESQLPRDGKFHKIKVEAFRILDDKRQNYKVRVREGWRF